DRNIKMLKADWTTHDPRITRALESYGRSGVPLYVLYIPPEYNPILLPEVLTESAVMTALERIRPTESTAPRAD
ncbi:MAG: hypothetical protein KDK27_03005, partial [Leptospiraceae bacterium]|nr:hypothetical protein [Leptospiraceae bacterium]